MENWQNPIRTEKVVLGILEIEIVTESDVGGEGVSAKVTKSDKRGGSNLDFSSDVIYEWLLT